MLSSLGAELEDISPALLLWGAELEDISPAFLYCIFFGLPKWQNVDMANKVHNLIIISLY